MFKYKHNLNPDDIQTSMFHRDIIQKKSFLKNIYLKWYQEFIKTSQYLPPGLLVELGSGGGFLKEVFPSVITSDIQPLQHCDKCFSAEQMPFEDKTVSGLFMINVFHHISNPRGFLYEAQRTLKKGGKIIIIDEANTLWGRFIYQNIHHEPFDPTKREWELPISGPMSSANGANSWIIFERDRDIFQQLFPELEVVSINHQMPFLYLLSGGVSRRALVPSWTFSFFRGLENLFRPFFKYFSMFQTITIVKK